MPRIRFDTLPTETQRRLLGRGIVADVQNIRAAGYDPAGYPLPILSLYTAMVETFGRDVATDWARAYFAVLSEEQRAAKMIDASRQWAATTSLEDDEKAAAARRDAEAKAKAAHERAVAARAKELLAADVADRAARARRRAEQELDR